MLLYFAYGSNMAAARLRQRLGAVERLGVARLVGYRLCFHVASTKDGSAKCDALRTGRDADLVYGVLYRIEPRLQEVLDRYEGVGIEYRPAMVTVHPLDGGAGSEALIYLGTRIDSALRPFPWYHQHVLRGAEENGLPEDYLAVIRGIRCIDDPDPQRAARELSIYRQG